MTARTGLNESHELIIDTFKKNLETHGLTLTRVETTVLQINMGLVCNQVCRHCHLEAGPGRPEAMDRETADQAADLARCIGFEIVDITGGAPELNDNLTLLIKRLAGSVKRIMLRANLTALTDGTRKELIELLVEHRVVLVASFPSINQAQADAQRGRGIYTDSVNALRQLNELGYAEPDTGLELNLVSNPAGAFLPPDQDKAEKRFRKYLEDKFGIAFNSLFTFANVPLGRFRKWLEQSGNYEEYLQRLARSFNPCAVEGLMCRNQVSLAWDGYLYDCDFNLAAGIPLGGRRTHVTELTENLKPGSPIAVADHCYTCTAGAGFT